MPKDLLASHDADLICKWLFRCLMETRKTDGTMHPLSSLRSLICEVNCVLDKEQTTKIECKSISVKEEKIADNGDSSMQDKMSSL